MDRMCSGLKAFYALNRTEELWVDDRFVGPVL